eukprot:10065039-Lingulodinium_polyedra.AAC.1
MCLSCAGVAVSANFGQPVQLRQATTFCLSNVLKLKESAVYLCHLIFATPLSCVLSDWLNYHSWKLY